MELRNKWSVCQSKNDKLNLKNKIEFFYELKLKLTLGNIVTDLPFWQFKMETTIRMNICIVLSSK